MSIRRFRPLLVAVLAIAALVPCAAGAHGWGSHAQPEFEQVVVFGDSLSDPGNAFVATGQYSVRPFAPIPSAPYLIGGFHFSNGSTWVERLSWRLKAPSGIGPALRAPQLFTNFAFGGARARAGAPGVSPDLGTQVAMHLANAGNTAGADSLYVLWLGANDVRDALESLAVDPSGAQAAVIVQAAIGATASNVVTLWSAGARTFLVLNVPDLARLPAVAPQPPPVPAAATQLSGAYNAALAQTLAGLEAQLPGTRIVGVDVFAIFDTVLDDPNAYGLSNTTEPCLRFGVIVGAVCAAPHRYVFWDAIHPTARMHAILAEHAAAALE